MGGGIRRRRGKRDEKAYYSLPLLTQIHALGKAGKALKEIEEIMGISYTDVVEYLPVSRVCF